MLRRQAYRFALRPSGQQLRNLRQFGGSCRFVYNKALALNTTRYNKKEKRLGYAGLCALLPNWKREHPFLAYTNFFLKRSEFPKFKKKGQREGFRVPQRFEVDNGNGRIKLPKIGWLRYRKSQEVLGAPKNVTISESCGKWFVAVQTEREVETPLHRSTSVVGLDWGVVRLYTLSNGEYREECQPLKKFLPKLAKLQRRMARKRKFSLNWKKVKAGIAKLHQRIANIRKEFLHRSSNEISKNHAVVFVEDLQVRNYVQVQQRQEGPAGEAGGPEVWAEPRDPGREPVRTAPSTGVQDRVEGRSVVSRAAPGILGRMRSGISR